MKVAWTAALAGLLSLAACSQASPTANNSATAPAPADDPNMMAADSFDSAPAPTMVAPRTEPETGGPRDAFIVCPGNPRCPPTGGTRPKADKPD